MKAAELHNCGKWRAQRLMELAGLGLVTALSFLRARRGLCPASPPAARADDEQLNACCEGPRTWYVPSDDDLRVAFSSEQIDAVNAGTISYLQYEGGGNDDADDVAAAEHKYAEGSLREGDSAPGCTLWRVGPESAAAGAASSAAGGGAASSLTKVDLLTDVLGSTRPLVLDFGSFS